MEELIKYLGNENMKLRFPSWRETKEALLRKKAIEVSEDSQLARVLSTLDLTALGVGSTLGVGVYVLAGDVAKTTAGPAVTVSFLIAAIASIFAGLCYAEFGARVPKAGSAYVYSYVCIGEFFAFIIGWNLVLEYLIGSAVVTKAIFIYIDELANKSMSTFFEDNMPMQGSQVGTYVDIFSLLMAIAFSVALAFGAKESSLLNNLLTFVNISVVLTVIISGFWKVDVANWNISKEEVHKQEVIDNTDYGNGGFAPYGFRGIIKGAARCFFGFIGFDCIATAGEEAKDPKKSIPIAVVASLLIVFLAYFGISTVLTMILPYFLQDKNAPLPHLYQILEWPAIRYMVSVGAICGLLSSLLGAMFPLPRIIYAMASDGLIFRSLSKIHPKFHTPFMGTLVAGLCAGVLAMIFELDKLSEMMSIGTLLAYSMVAACVLILRFTQDEPSTSEETTFRDFILNMMKSRKRNPTSRSQNFVTWNVFLYFCTCFIFAGLITIFEDTLSTSWLIAILIILAIALITFLVMISFQPRSSAKLAFNVPFVPWIPGFSILINIYLMTNIKKDTWIKYIIWIALGLVIYFGYGVWFSDERKNKKLRNGESSSQRNVKSL